MGEVLHVAPHGRTDADAVGEGTGDRADGDAQPSGNVGLAQALALRHRMTSCSLHFLHKYA
jgi:hypothetical protein